jgi:septal ring factor EnvC (AmiA/AmiB activator)
VRVRNLPRAADSAAMFFRTTAGSAARLFRTTAGSAAIFVAFASFAAAVAAVELGDALREGDAGNQAAAAAQQQIEQVSDEADRLFTEYRRTLQEIDSLRLYNDQLREVVDSQRGEIQELQTQIDDIDDVERRLGPLMSRMIDVLERFVELDVPFLADERTERMADLREMMKRSDVSLSEKYRRLMEAYQVENEYGRTIEAYKGTLEEEGGDRTVEFLRIGRIALLYQTVDMEESGRWDGDSKSWVVLGDEFRRPIRNGIRMANKQTAPDLVKIPVPAPETVQ